MIGGLKSRIERKALSRRASIRVSASVSSLPPSAPLGKQWTSCVSADGEDSNPSGGEVGGAKGVLAPAEGGRGAGLRPVDVLRVQSPPGHCVFSLSFPDARPFTERRDVTFDTPPPRPPAARLISRPSETIKPAAAAAAGGPVCVRFCSSSGRVSFWDPFFLLNGGKRGTQVKN